jgi:hypothetical protein
MGLTGRLVATVFALIACRNTCFGQDCPPFVDPCSDAGGEWITTESSCATVIAAIEDHCDGGVPGENPWSSSLGEQGCSWAPDCLPTFPNGGGPAGNIVCNDDVQQLLNSIADAGSCAEANAASCPAQ